MKTRIRTHSFPGEIPRRDKIARWEGKLDDFITQKGAQARRKAILSRERAIMKERLRRELEEAY
jgi:hypothetical protein